jgi:hypothetical protein
VKTVENKKEEKLSITGDAKVLKELADDPEWGKKLEQAKNNAEIIKVIRDFCKVKGYKVMDVTTP